MILLLFGQDELGVRRRLQALRAEADGGTGMLETNLSTIEGRDATPAGILGPAMSPPFLAPARLVVVEGFLNRFEPRGDQRQPRSVAAFEPLFTGLESGLPPTTLLVFTGLPPDDPRDRSRAFQRNPMIDRLKKIPGVTVEAHAEVKGDSLIRFIKDEAAARGIRLRQGPFRGTIPEDDELRRIADPAAYLAALLPGDTLAVANELDKLALYSMGHEVTVDTVSDVCSGRREANRFAFIDAVMDGDHGRALQVRALLEEDGMSWQELLALLLGGYRTLATAIDLIEEGATPEEIGKAIGRPWPGLRDKAITRARRLGPSGLRAAFAAMVEADRESKLGNVDDDLAVDLLIAKLCALAPISPSRR